MKAILIIGLYLTDQIGVEYSQTNFWGWTKTVLRILVLAKELKAQKD